MKSNCCQPSSCLALFYLQGEKERERKRMIEGGEGGDGEKYAKGGKTVGAEKEGKKEKEIPREERE